MIFKTLQVNIELPYHYRYNLDLEALVAEMAKKPSRQQIREEPSHPNAFFLKTYLERLQGDLSQFVDNDDNIYITMDPKLVIEKLLEKYDGKYPVLVINEHFNSILLFYTAFLMFFSCPLTCAHGVAWILSLSSESDL